MEVPSFCGKNNLLNWILIFIHQLSKFVFCFQNRLRGSGHGIAAARMDAKLNVAGWISEKMGGVRLAYLNVLN